MQLQPPRAWLSPKSGNRPDENEDNYRVAYPLRIGCGGKDAARIALSDGATEAAFAKEWAQILTQDFVDRPPDLTDAGALNLENWLAPCQAQWNRVVPWEGIPWHGEAKVRAGAVATLLGLTFSRRPGQLAGLAWQAVSVGDCCLFLIRQDELALAFPLDDAGQFDNAPALLCSNPANQRQLPEAARLAGGDCQAGDVFTLASDALAAWFLASHAKGQKPWQTLLALEKGAWEPWLQAQREERLMRNDDTTLLVIQVR